MLKVNTKSREVFVYDQFGPEWAGMISASAMIDALDQLGAGEVNLRINSPGGTADEAFAMLELLKRHDGFINVTVDSLAASAASFFLAPEFKVTAAKHARVMIHKPMGLTYGNIADHEKTISVLKAYGESLIQAYGRIKKTPEEIDALLESETWFTAQQALEIGLVDSINEKAPYVEPAKIPENRFKNLPKDLVDPKPAKVETPFRIAAELRLRELQSRWR